METINNLKSKYVKDRKIEVWLPEGFNANQKYAVLYMHDGQMLFDSTTTWNKQEWRVDETMTSLQSANAIKPTIVVAVSNIPELRYAEYFPQKIVDQLPAGLKDTLLTNAFKSEPLADNYLKFLVQELKPYIDSNYPTYTDAPNTYIMGSSMGGLISLYALCEYPQVFGGAGCLSTHTPMISPVLPDGTVVESNAVATQFREYLRANLPEANSRKIYMDYGDQELDSYYKPYQTKIDELLVSLGWKYPYWQTKEFKEENHSEKAWAKRLHIPLVFLLK